MHVTPLGDTTLVLTLGDRIDEPTLARVQSTWRALAAARLPAVVELVPAYTTVTVFYDPGAAVGAGAPPDNLVSWLGGRVEEVARKAAGASRLPKGRVIDLPVCYDREHAPDLAAVASQAGLTPKAVVDLHLAGDYLVYLIGFAPGFPYLGGLAPELAVPRRPVPRRRVPPGSVGIVGAQCGIYPIETPAGWNLIGRTPVRLFRPAEDPPVLLQVGDRVRFRAISSAEFHAMSGEGA